MSYKIFYDKQPEKFLGKIDKHVAARIKNKIETALTENHFPHNAATISGKHGVFRIRIGDYRALYRINYETNSIIIVVIDKRSRVYE